MHSNIDTCWHGHINTYKGVHMKESLPALGEIDVANPQLSEETERLSVRERLFVTKYCECLSAARAAHDAGFGDHMGRTLLRRERIAAAVRSELESSGMGVKEVVARLSRVASATMDDFITIDESGYARVDLAKAERLGVLGCIKKLEYVDGLPKIELMDSMAALDRLAKIAGLYVERVQIDTTQTIDVNVNKKIMVAAMADPAKMAQLIALAESVAGIGNAAPMAIEATATRVGDAVETKASEDTSGQVAATPTGTGDVPELVRRILAAREVSGD